MRQQLRPGQSKGTCCGARVPAWESASATSTSLPRPQGNSTERQSADQAVPRTGCFQSTDLAIWEDCLKHHSGSSDSRTHPWGGTRLSEPQPGSCFSPFTGKKRWLPDSHCACSLSLHLDVGRGICRRLSPTASGRRSKPEDNTEFLRANTMLLEKIKILHLSYVAGQQVTQESTELWSFPLWASPLPALVHNLTVPSPPTCSGPCSVRGRQDWLSLWLALSSARHSIWAVTAALWDW